MSDNDFNESYDFNESHDSPREITNEEAAQISFILPFIEKANVSAYQASEDYARLLQTTSDLSHSETIIQGLLFYFKKRDELLNEVHRMYPVEFVVYFTTMKLSKHKFRCVTL